MITDALSKRTTDCCCSAPAPEWRWGSCSTSSSPASGWPEGGSASGVLQAVQQLASGVGVAALGTVFFSAFAGNPPTHALAITVWACLAPVAIAFALILRLPMDAREAQI